MRLVSESPEQASPFPSWPPSQAPLAVSPSKRFLPQLLAAAQPPLIFLALSGAPGQTEAEILAL